MFESNAPRQMENVEKPEVRKVKCDRCKEEIVGDFEDIDTPNYIFRLCMDCAMDIEDKVYEWVGEGK